MEWRKLRWRDQRVIPHYEIDRHGTIRCTLSDEFEVLYKQKCSPKGNKPKYYWYALIRRNAKDKWIAIHRLMCYTWLGEFPHALRFICDHVDSDSTNNELYNLRYLTIRGNNLNRSGVHGLVFEDGKWIPRIAGYVHRRYGHTDLDFARGLRHTLLQSYIRYTSRFPDSDGYPHKRISNF